MTARSAFQSQQVDAPGVIKPDGTTITVNSETGEASAAAGEPQEQADWNQTDDTKVDFIKNKPTMPQAGNDTPQPLKNVPSPGRSSNYSREDHVHSDIELRNAIASLQEELAAMKAQIAEMQQAIMALKKTA